MLRAAVQYRPILVINISLLLQARYIYSIFYATALTVRQVYSGSATESSAIKSMSEVLNDNPTIRNASDLPSRRRQGDSHSQSKTPKGLFASTIPSSAYLPDPFAPHSLESDVSDDDEDEIEPIDEQEIYGRITPPSPHLSLDRSTQ